MKKTTRRGPTVAVATLMVASVVTTGVIAGLTMAAKPAYGCSCMRPGSAEAERDRATAVFAGTVTSITPLNSSNTSDGISGEDLYSGSPFPPNGGYSVEFAVSEQWKGDVGATVSVNTAEHGAACGYGFEAGEAYLVYTYGEADDMSVGLCGRTNALANAAADIAVLGEGVPGENIPPAEVMDKKSGCQNVGFMRRVLQGAAGAISQLFVV